MPRPARFLVPLLILSLAGCSPVPDSSAPEGEASAPPPPTRPPVVHLSIPDKVREGGDRYKADWSFDLRAGDPRFSMHVHVIPPGQYIPLHQHPDNIELVAIAGGEAEWEGVLPEGSGLREVRSSLGPGDLVLSRATCPHGVRNRGTEPLATVVLHEPEFGQNWYLKLAELPASSCATEPLGREGELPEGLFSSITAERWVVEQPRAVESPTRESLYVVLEGSGLLRFEDKALPLAPGTFSKLPAGLTHRLVPAGAPLRLLRVEAPEG